jgi:hypothetical protein
LTGQCLIKTTANNISKFIQKVVKDKSVKPLVYGDTDSCGPHTVLNLQMNNIDSNMTIEDYYNTVTEDYCKYDEKNQQFVKLVTNNDKILTVNDNQLVYTPIKYVMKHRVKKHMYKLKIHNESITITEDHSLMVERDGKLVKVKPVELQKTDHILYLFDKKLYKDTAWELIDLGVQEMDVYDIETENHMFFGNNILVHNSCYIDLYPIYQHFVLDKGKSIPEKERVDFYDEICKTIEKKDIEPTLSALGSSLNSFQNCLAMKREVICAGSDESGYCGFWVAKKRYALRVNDNEGFRYEHPKLKIMGLAQVQSSTPKVCRDNLSKATSLMIEEGEQAVQDYVKEVSKEFFKKSVEEIALPRSVSDVVKYADSDMRPIKGAPVQSKAAINHNYLVHKLGLDKHIQLIRDGEKLKFLYLNPNPYGFDVIGFRDKLPKEFKLEKYVNKDAHFQKAFRKPLSDMMEACSWTIEEKADLSDFF